MFVLVRPGTEFFLQRLSKCYELVIYTASLSKYADPLVDILDARGLIDSRLFREHCTSIQGVYVKDMSLLGRPMTDSLIIDNSPTSYTFHQENAIPILSWYDDPKDRCLFELIPLLESLAEVDDVRKYIPQFVTADHRVDFQRASHVLANAVTIPNAMNDKKRAAMSMHRVSEHREEDEDEEEGGGNGKKRSNQRLSGIKVSNGGDDEEVVSGGSSPDKFGSRKISASGKKKHQPLLYNNAWVVDEEGREIQQPPNDEAEGGAAGPQ